MESWECPTCGVVSPRALDKEKHPAFDEMELGTTRGPVPFKGPLFYCKHCRSFFPRRGFCLNSVPNPTPLPFFRR